MKKILILLCLVGPFCFAQNATKTIQGQITDGRTSIENVAVSIKDGTSSKFSDANGHYTIEAEVGDLIEYSYQGLKTVAIKVEDVTRILNITMVPDIEELDEVIVKGSNRKSQSELELEYPSNPNIIRTAYGYLNAETAAGNIRFMNSEEINPVTLCILDLLRNQFAGIRVQGDCSGAFGPTLSNASGGGSNLTGNERDNEIGVVGLITAAGTGLNGNLNQGKVFVRGNSSLLNERSAIFDVDGQILNDPPLWLDVKNIKRMAILNNFATATAYGSAGAGGVIVVNTISASPKADAIYDRARLRNNFVSGTVLSQEDLQNNAPAYLRDLRASNSLAEAKSTYEKYAATYAGSPYFFLDAQHYFSTKWNEKSFADDIIASNYAIFEKNAVLLKALAYQYQELGALEKAKQTFKQVLKLRPSYAQSYLDMSNSYADLKEAQQAAALFARYSYLTEEGLMPADSVGFGPFFEREYNNFLYLNKNSVLEGQRAADLYIAEEDFQGTRLVFDWNDSEAEFELQFVNPENQYYTWKHSLEANDALIASEKNYGYATTEYLIDGSLPGNWKVNVTYLGNKSLTPTYLKATIYHNYGTYGQRKEVKVFKLMLKGVNQELFALPISAMSITQ